MKNFFFLLVALVGLSRPTEAQQVPLLGVLSEEHYSVVKVIEAAGCVSTLPLLQQVLKESNIKPSQVRRLPVGQKVFFSGTCKASQVSMHSEEYAVAHASDSLKFRAVTESLITFVGHARVLEKAVKDTSAKFLNQLTEVNRKAAAWRFRFWALFIVIVCALVGSGATYALRWYRIRRNLLEPHRRSSAVHIIDEDSSFGDILSA